MLRPFPNEVWKRATLNKVQALVRERNAPSELPVRDLVDVHTYFQLTFPQIELWWDRRPDYISCLIHGFFSSLPPNWTAIFLPKIKIHVLYLLLHVLHLHLLTCVILILFPSELNAFTHRRWNDIFVDMIYNWKLSAANISEIFDKLDAIKRLSHFFCFVHNAKLQPNKIDILISFTV